MGLRDYDSAHQLLTENNRLELDNVKLHVLPLPVHLGGKGVILSLFYSLDFLWDHSFMLKVKGCQPLFRREWEEVDN